MLHQNVFKESWQRGKYGRKKLHKQNGRQQPWEECQAKLFQELGGASQGMGWGWCHWVKSCHTLMCPENGLDMLLSSSQATLEPETR